MTVAVLERKPTTSPDVSPETREFWAAAADGRLLVKNCPDCGRNHYYPRTVCPHCFGDRTRWLESTGRGTIYSFTVMRRAGPPYALAYVTLDEGVTMMTNIVGCEPDAIAVGMRVVTRFVATPDGPPVPMFVLEASAKAMP